MLCNNKWPRNTIRRHLKNDQKALIFSFCKNVSAVFPCTARTIITTWVIDFNSFPFKDALPQIMLDDGSLSVQVQSRFQHQRKLPIWLVMADVLALWTLCIIQKPWWTWYWFQNNIIGTNFAFSVILYKCCFYSNHYQK